MWHALVHLAVALAGVLTSLPGVAAQPVPVVDPLDGIDVGDLPVELAGLVTWSVGLFDEAELELPPVRFVYHGDDTTPCSGWGGVHRSADGRSTIDICRSDAGGATPWLFLHELAHAWAAHDLDDGRRADFQALRGWTHWSDHEELEWHERGTEQAAEIIAWGLIDRPVGVVTIHDNTCDDLDAGYRTLTGRPPLHGYRDHC